MFFQILSHDFLAECYYDSPIFIAITAKATSDPGQLFEASPCPVKNEGQNSMAGRQNTAISWMLWIQLSCLGEVELRCLFAAQLPSAALLVLLVSIQTHKLHFKRHSYLYQTEEEILKEIQISNWSETKTPKPHIHLYAEV